MQTKGYSRTGGLKRALLTRLHAAQEQRCGLAVQIIIIIGRSAAGKGGCSGLACRGGGRGLPRSVWKAEVGAEASALLQRLSKSLQCIVFVRTNAF